MHPLTSTTTGAAESRPFFILMLSTARGWRGGERILFSLATSLPDWIRTTVACPGETELARRCRDAGVRTVAFEARGSSDFGAVLRLRRHLKENRCDLLHAHTSHAHALGLLARAGLGLPLVVTRHVAFSIKRFSRWKYRAVDRFAAVSECVRQVLTGAGVSPDAVDVIYNGIDLGPFSGERATARAQLDFSPAETLVVSAGALSREKNQALLLEAWAGLFRRFPHARLLLAGSGPLEKELRTMADRRGLERIDFLGHREDVPTLLLASDVYVSTSDTEGLSLSVMEAMAAGLPVVATAAGGVKELVDEGDTGLTVPLRDAPALGDALAALLADPARRIALGQRGRARALASFGLPAMAERYARFYRAALAGRPSEAIFRSPPGP